MLSKKIEKLGRKAILDLRRLKLNRGQTFMINASHLSSDECYLEYPDGRILLVKLCRETKDFQVIEKYSKEQEMDIRRKNGLLPVQLKNSISENAGL